MEGKIRKSTPYHHGDLRNALIRHTLSIMEAEGIEGLTLRKAARSAGVSHTAPAHHFGDLRGLLAAVAEEGFRLMVVQMEEAIGSSSNHPLERLKAVGLAYVEFALRHPAFFRVMYHPMLAMKSAYPGLKQVSLKALDLLTDLVRECQDMDLIVAGDARELGLFAWSTVHGLATLHMNGQIEGKGLGENIMEHAQKVTALIYSGLRKHTA
ncbi:MAG: TetR/AcrR family transcriptional regulator [Proteobacteria bacterium]|nr:TetR/AcrR family transcriptional regulator [Pseudomonadota bacterium]